MLQKPVALARLVAKPIKLFLNHRLDLKVRAITGLVPITKYLEDDVFIIGYPKSGHTWVQNLLSGVIHGVDPEYASDTLVQDLVPDVHYKRYYKRYRTPMFFKSHHLPRPEYKRVVYLLRDGRDVMVSFFHHLTALQNKEIDFLTMVQSCEELFPGKWHEHVERWLSNPYNAQLIIVKYEELKRNPVNELQRFLRFVDVERSDSFLELIAMKTSFEKMRQKEINYGWDDPQWPKDKPFVRRGKVGSYKNEMPTFVLEAFLHEAGDTLRKCGYLK